MTDTCEFGHQLNLYISLCRHKQTIWGGLEEEEESRFRLAEEEGRPVTEVKEEEEVFGLF